MNRRLEIELRVRGASSASDLARALQVSQPTISRHLARLGPRIVRLGRGRSTLYALSREVAPLGQKWPLYRIDTTGNPHLVGTLRSLEARQWALQQAEPWETLNGEMFQNGLFPDLPWFLNDLRPQGFLGRIFARTSARELHLPSDLNLWNADHVLQALVLSGSDLPGDWVLGEQMLTKIFAQRLQEPEAMTENERLASYPQRAASTLAGEWPGSSAGGEQPKFTACIVNPTGERRHVIVKFSGDISRSENRRWADLLISEHLAAALLSEHGVPAARTEYLFAGNRLFLESTRFDRVGDYGRRGIVSLLALDEAFFSQFTSPWSAAAGRLEEREWISRESAERLTLLWWFGTLIGNTDMHYGNASLFLTPSYPLSLAPSYDMLPMLYRPDVQGTLAPRNFAPSPPTPEAMPFWRKAIAMAHIFWERVAATDSISPDFRAIARQNARILLKHQRAFGNH